MGPAFLEERRPQVSHRSSAEPVSLKRRRRFGRVRQRICGFTERRGRDADERASRRAEFRSLAQFGCCRRGRAIPLCPRTSDVDLFGYRESVVDLDAEIAHRALDFLVSQQKLYRPQVASTAVNEGRFGPPE